MNAQFYVPAGRINDLRTRGDADRIAYTVPRQTFADYACKVYASRAAMLAFCKDGSAHHALVKSECSAGMLTNRNTQRIAW